MKNKKMTTENLKMILTNYAGNLSNVDFDEVFTDSNEAILLCSEYSEKLFALPDEDWEQKDEELMSEYATELKKILR